MHKANSAKRDTVKSCPVTLEEIADKQNLYQAYINARKGKRSRKSCFEFELNLTKNIDHLHNTILDGSYCPSEPYRFTLYCVAAQKTREIAAPAFIDCVVQHAIYQLIYDHFDRKFIYDSYGCRKNKGTHRASDRCQQFMRKHSGDSYFLQIDMSKYYNNMNHSYLKESFDRTIEDTRVVDLIMKFPYTDSPSGIGMNIGNLISQLCGIIYLDRIDHYVKRVLKIKHYIRYVDDMIFIGLSKEQANLLLTAMKTILNDRLGMNLSKALISKLKYGINFVGYRTWKSRKFIRKRTLHAFSRALSRKEYEKLVSILSHSYQTSSYRSLINRIVDYMSFRELKQNFPRRYYRDLLLCYLQRKWPEWNQFHHQNQ